MSYPYSLPSLPYAFDALEPHIDAQTMQIHHGKHHQAYVNNLNAALEKAPEWQKKGLGEVLAQLDKVPEAVRTAVRNNGGGHWNHTAFWKLMAPKARRGRPRATWPTSSPRASAASTSSRSSSPPRPWGGSAPAGRGCCSSRGSSPS